MKTLLDTTTEIYVYEKPVDMRKSYDGLFSLVRKRGIFKGGIFVFLSKDRKRSKSIFWDGSGLTILMKRMEHGRFIDITRRGSITHEELVDFYLGSAIIKKV